MTTGKICIRLGVSILAVLTLAGCNNDEIFGPSTPRAPVADPMPETPTPDWTRWGSLGFDSVSSAFAAGTSLPDVCRKSAVVNGRVVPNQALLVTSGQVTGCNFATAANGKIRSNCLNFQYSTLLDPRYPVQLSCQNFSYVIRRVVNVDGKFVTGKIIGQVDPKTCMVSLTIEDDLPTDRIEMTTVTQLGGIPMGSGTNRSSKALFDCRANR
jgi:hypothetical protein